MVRLVETSRGRLTVQRSTAVPLLGKNVTVSVFDADGWEKTTKTWSSKYGFSHREEPLSEFLARMAGLPEQEARTLADSILHSWPTEAAADGDGDDARELRHRAYGVLAALALIAALAGIGLLSLVLLLV